MRIALSVNGQPHALEVRETDMLIDVLRERLGYVGTNKDCEQGICGCCTVLMNGELATACLVLAGQADGAEVLTIEGLEQSGRLHKIQQSFLVHGAVQCGYCTPGMIMTAKALLDENPRPTRNEIADAIRGNLCRCTGYIKIIDAIEAAAQS
ncbi:MAG: (2Fe-2S)-binding protein [Hyphomicrobiales bacterium]|nr:(2Fe-2S)-binding protein [Hyphomicrobiales bacterium]